MLNASGMIKSMGGINDTNLSCSIGSNTKSSFSTSSIMEGCLVLLASNSTFMSYEFSKYSLSCWIFASSSRDSSTGWIGSTTHGLGGTNCTSVALLFLFHHKFVVPQYYWVEAIILPSWAFIPSAFLDCFLEGLQYVFQCYWDELRTRKSSSTHLIFFKLCHITSSGSISLT